MAAKLFGMMMENLNEFAVVPEQFHDAGEVIVQGRRAVGKTKGGSVLDAPAARIWTVRDGLVVMNHNYHDTDGWRLGLPR